MNISSNMPFNRELASPPSRLEQKSETVAQDPVDRLERAAPQESRSGFKTILGCAALAGIALTTTACSPPSNVEIDSGGRSSFDIGNGVRLRSDGTTSVDVGNGVRLNSDGTTSVDIGNGMKLNSDGTVGFDF